MEADFSGYATKADLKCTDGRTITPDAFKHQDKMSLPLVWQHGHDSAENVLGHVDLEARADGMYCYGYFNSTDQGKNAKLLVQHKDVSKLSIWANELIEKSKQVLHGSIKEVSLVLAGANPGAQIDFVRIAHSDDRNEDEVLADEAIIHTGLDIQLETASEDTEEGQEQEGEDIEHSDDEPTVDDIFQSMTDDQKDVTNFLINKAVDDATSEGKLQHAAPLGADATVQDVYDTFNAEQKDLVNYLISEAVAEADTTAAHSALNDKKEGTIMTNVFERDAAGRTAGKARKHLSHDALTSIVEDAKKNGSFKDAFLNHLEHAADYGIEDIDILFPDAQALSNQPDLISRRSEWVTQVVDAANHSPFSRVKSVAADITADEARAKGYVKGNLKKDEIVKLLTRKTLPTTVYKKQKLDRDDIVDITDLDVVAWLKAEMRLMLQEELGRAILIGDGREADDDDKIDEDSLRPIAFDDDMYAHKVVIQSNASPEDIIEGVIRARKNYKGTGRPTFFTTDDVITDLLLIKDKMGRYVYDDENSLAAKLRVTALVPVEVMEDEPDIIGIMVNMSDYTIGADRGGALSMFDDFDIDYNQFKYLMETRVSGALTKPKSAVVISRVSGTTVTPTAPGYDPATHTLTFPSTAGVEYFVDGAKVTGTEVISETTDVEARPAAGYSFPHGTDADWTYAYTA